MFEAQEFDRFQKIAMQRVLALGVPTEYIHLIFDSGWSHIQIEALGLCAHAGLNIDFMIDHDDNNSSLATWSYDTHAVNMIKECVRFQDDALEERLKIVNSLNGLIEAPTYTKEGLVTFLAHLKFSKIASSYDAINHTM
jgi:hypothetical protein